MSRTTWLLMLIASCAVMLLATSVGAQETPAAEGEVPLPSTGETPAAAVEYPYHGMGSGSGAPKRSSDGPQRRRIHHAVSESVKEVIAKHKEDFKSHDADNDGQLSFGEFTLVQKGLDNETTDEEIGEMFADEDLNGDGQVSFQEWQFALQTGVRTFLDAPDSFPGSGSGPGIDSLAAHRATFDDLDIDKNGVITEDEVAKGWTDAEGKPDQAWKRYDVDKNGRLTFEEYVQNVDSPDPHDDDDDDHDDDDDDEEEEDDHHDENDPAYHFDSDVVPESGEESGHAFDSYGTNSPNGAGRRERLFSLVLAGVIMILLVVV